MRNRRRAARYLFGVAAKLSYLSEPTTLTVTATNISLKGCCVDEIGDLKVGEDCRLGIEYRGAVMEIQVKVKWKDAEGRAGLEFLSVDAQKEGPLADLCSTLQLQPVNLPPEQVA